MEVTEEAVQAVERKLEGYAAGALGEKLGGGSEDGKIDKQKAQWLTGKFVGMIEALEMLGLRESKFVRR